MVVILAFNDFLMFLFSNLQDKQSMLNNIQITTKEKFVVYSFLCAFLRSFKIEHQTTVTTYLHVQDC